MSSFLMTTTEAFLIETSGKQDRANGVDRGAGWIDLCKDMGWDPYNSRLQREKYEDGWYAGVEAKSA